eukprot:CAMPEP_0183588826 /NCGR_PEP_ID=MMETSP0371-20130417/161555_1 /TAXON_ID=268820 /ORGANISM="Peridinium aciculiferum, Strain PAER-2" /LENGTH=43 /DNA_ID= /DNA_START= /DNA_END= /DNA_ORIENTATION=
MAQGKRSSSPATRSDASEASTATSSGSPTPEISATTIEQPPAE